MIDPINMLTLQNVTIKFEVQSERMSTSVKQRAAAKCVISNVGRLVRILWREVKLFWTSLRAVPIFGEELVTDIEWIFKEAVPFVYGLLKEITKEENRQGAIRARDKFQKLLKDVSAHLKKAENLVDDYERLLILKTLRTATVSPSRSDPNEELAKIVTNAVKESLQGPNQEDRAERLVAELCSQSKDLFHAAMAEVYAFFHDGSITIRDAAEAKANDLQSTRLHYDTVDAFDWNPKPYYHALLKGIRRGEIFTPNLLKNEFGMQLLVGFMYIRDGARLFYPVIQRVKRAGIRWFRTTRSTSGLKWKGVGQVGPNGTPLINAKLSAALKEKREFSHSEWAEFDIKGLCSSHFILVDQNYFQPIEDKVDGDEIVSCETPRTRDDVVCLDPAHYDALRAMLTNASSHGKRSELSVSYDDVASGLEWQELDTKPRMGAEFVHARLQILLGSKTSRDERVTLTPDEWRGLKILTLNMNQFVVWKERHFKPAVRIAGFSVVPNSLSGASYIEIDQPKEGSSVDGVSEKVYYRTVDEDERSELWSMSVGIQWEKVEATRLFTDGAIWEEVPNVYSRDRNMIAPAFSKYLTTQKDRIAHYLSADQISSFRFGASLTIDNYVKTDEPVRYFKPRATYICRVQDQLRFRRMIRDATENEDQTFFSFPTPFQDIDSALVHDSVVEVVGIDGPLYYRVVPTANMRKTTIPIEKIDALVSKDKRELDMLRDIVDEWKLYLNHIEYTKRLALSEARGHLPLITPETKKVHITEHGTLMLAVHGMSWNQLNPTEVRDAHLDDKQRVFGDAARAVLEQNKTSFSHKEAWRNALRWEEYEEADHLPLRWETMSVIPPATAKITLFPRLGALLQKKKKGKHIHLLEEEWRAHNSTSRLWTIEFSLQKSAWEKQGLNNPSVQLDEETRKAVDGIETSARNLRVNLENHQLVEMRLAPDESSFEAVQRRVTGTDDFPVRWKQYVTHKVANDAFLYFVCEDKSMTTWSVVGDEGFIQMNIASGLRWREVAEAEVEGGTTLDNVALINALASKAERRVEFSKSEWENIGVTTKPLRADRHYVRAGGRFFKPDRTEFDAAISRLNADIGREREFGRPTRHLERQLTYYDTALTEARAREEQEDASTADSPGAFFTEVKRERLVDALLSRLTTSTIHCAHDFDVEQFDYLKMDGFYLYPVVFSPSSFHYLAVKNTIPTKTKTSVQALRWELTEDKVNEPSGNIDRLKQHIATLKSKLGKNWTEVEKPADGTKIHVDAGKLLAGMTSTDHTSGLWVKSDDALVKTVRTGTLRLDAPLTKNRIMSWVKWDEGDIVKSGDRYFRTSISPIVFDLATTAEQQSEGVYGWIDFKIDALEETHVVEVDGQRFKPAVRQDEIEETTTEYSFYRPGPNFESGWMFTSIDGEVVRPIMLRQTKVIAAFKEAMADRDATHLDFSRILGQRVSYDTIVKFDDGSGERYRLRGTDWMREAYVQDGSGDASRVFAVRPTLFEFSALWGPMSVEWKEGDRNSPPTGDYDVSYLEYGTSGRVFLVNADGDKYYSFANTSETAVSTIDAIRQEHLRSNRYLRQIDKFLSKVATMQDPRQLRDALELLKSKDSKLFSEIQTGSLAQKLRFYRDQETVDVLESAISGEKNVNDMAWNNSYSTCSYLKGKVRSRQAAVEETGASLNKMLAEWGATVAFDGTNDPAKLFSSIEEVSKEKHTDMVVQTRNLRQLQEIEQKVDNFKKLALQKNVDLSDIAGVGGVMRIEVPKKKLIESGLEILHERGVIDMRSSGRAETPTFPVDSEVTAPKSHPGAVALL